MIILDNKYIQFREFDKAQEDVAAGIDNLAENGESICTIEVKKFFDWIKKNKPELLQIEKE